MTAKTSQNARKRHISLILKWLYCYYDTKYYYFQPNILAKSSIKSPKMVRRNQTFVDHIVLIDLYQPATLATPDSAFRSISVFMPGFCYYIISSIALFLGSLSILTVFWRNSGLFIIPYIEGFYIIFCMPSALAPPPIIAAACFIKSGLLIIYWTIGLFIISFMFPMLGGIAGICTLFFTSSYYELLDWPGVNVVGIYYGT